ncbi:MAG TPA: hypothetical protein VIL72_14605 [Beijerinckiaceae bacterium]|jgi:hypothetical protein
MFQGGSWTSDIVIMLALVGVTLLFAAAYAALEKVFPFLRGGSGRI